METELLIARAKDTIDAVFRNDKPKYFGFLSKEEKVLIERFLENRNIKFTFFGGDSYCERVFLCCFPEWMVEPNFPITAVTFTYRMSDSLRHRDVLGALMALGIKRETVGDILIEQGRAVVFLSNDVANFVIENIDKIGNIGVAPKIGVFGDLPERKSLVENSATISSLRLDCVVCALVKCSRNTANTLIENGLVTINSVICQKSTKLVENGDVLSVRQKGKFEIISTDKKTKKERIILAFKSY